jgi:hypothetical protein
MGVTGRRIVEALIAGEDSPAILSWKVRGKLRKKEKLVKESPDWPPLWGPQRQGVFQ